MDAINLLIYGVASLISLYFICQIWPKRMTSGPPEPAGRWPIIGHLHLFSRTTPFHRTLSALSDRYGPVFLLHLGQHRALVVSSMELAKECFTTNDRAFASRPASLSTKYLSYDYAMFGLSPYGSYWREVRKICTLELLSNRRLELLKHIQLEEVDSLVKSLYRDCGKEEPVQMKTRLAFMTMKVMLRMVAGKQYLTNEDDDIGEDKEARETNKFLEELASMLGVYTAADAIPWLEWLDVGGHLKAMKRVHKTMDKIATSWVAEHRRRRESGNIGDTHDFMDVLISQLDDAHLSDVLQPDTIVKATTMILIVAGTSTTLETLLWALSLLLNHRLELKMVKEELDFHVGRERQVDQSDISKLSYLQAVVKETLRLYPVGPVLVPRESIQPVNVAGYHVPAGTSLYVNVWKMHRDPSVWHDPEEFKPGRFLTSHKEVNVNGQNFELIPFGSGRRSCPGSSLALQIAHLTLARLLHGFECCTPMDGPVDMTEEIGFALTKATPLHVLLHPRLPQQLYQ